MTHRVQELIQELRRPDLTPSRGFLYLQDTTDALSACIEGIVNEMAIRNGLPVEWLAMEIEDGEGTPITIWEVEPPSPDGVEPIETSNAALPEALLYHGFDMPDGKLSIDILDCDPVFIRTVINTRHGTSFGASSGAILNDPLVRQGANPLLIAADIFEHLLDRPNQGIWDGRINRWATTRQQTPVQQTSELAANQNSSASTERLVQAGQTWERIEPSPQTRASVHRHPQPISRQSARGSVIERT